MTKKRKQKPKPKRSSPRKSEAQRLVQRLLNEYRAEQQSDLALFKYNLRERGIRKTISWCAQSAARAEAVLHHLDYFASRLRDAGDTTADVLEVARRTKEHLIIQLTGDPGYGRFGAGVWVSGSANLFDQALHAEGANAVRETLKILDEIEAMVSGQAEDDSPRERIREL